LPIEFLGWSVAEILQIQQDAEKLAVLAPFGAKDNSFQIQSNKLKPKWKGNRELRLSIHSVTFCSFAETASKSYDAL
jgi:hypothetical protein